MKTDTSEKGLETLICVAMTGSQCLEVPQVSVVHEPTPVYGGTGWICGAPDDYDREYAVDLAQLRAFLQATR